MDLRSATQVDTALQISRDDSSTRSSSARKGDKLQKRREISRITRALEAGLDMDDCKDT